jgi:hypothetical protein
MGTYTGFKQLQVVLLPEGALLTQILSLWSFLCSGKFSETGEMEPETDLHKSWFHHVL